MLRQKLLVEKFRNPLGFSVLLAVSLCIAAATAYKGIIAGALMLTGLAALPVIYSIAAYPRFGMMALLLISYLLFFLMRQGISFPMGTLVDGIQLLLFAAMLLRLKKEQNGSVFREPVAILIMIWIGYNIVVVANPVAASRLAWVYSVRSVAIVMLMYFIFSYQIRSVAFIRQLFKLWLALAVFGALYAIKQEYIGFSFYELEWIRSDPRIEELFFIDAHWRKFSIFSDPMVYSYNMAAAAILCLSLLSGPFAGWKKAVLALLAVLFGWVMLYSGTRSAYVLIPAAMILYSVLKFNRRSMLLIGITGTFFAVLVFTPTSNPLLIRFQTAFKPSDDPSFNVRTTNQKLIQPYIRSHPIGGGLGATGGWGQRFAPDSYLANFPPDSGYVRIAVELGWIGLLLFCILMFVILKAGIDNYYRIRDPELKTYCLAMTLIIFAFNIGNYPQEALVQFPSNIIFFLAAALINVTYRLDRQMHPETKTL